LATSLLADGTAPSARDIRTGNLTDQQKQTMENYQHQGYLQRDYKEKLDAECESKGYSKDECLSVVSGADATTSGKFMGMSPTMIKGVAQAYTMIIGMSGVGSTLKKNEGGVSNLCNASDSMCSDSGEKTKKLIDKRDDAAAALEKQKDDVTKKASTDAEAELDGDKTKNGQDKDEMEDYCRYIPVGTEAIALFQQKAEQDFINSTPSQNAETQADILYKQARSHEGRAKSVKTQVIGWGATTGCYVAMLAGPASPSAWQNWLKLGASTLLWRYYDWEKKEHEKAQKTVEGLASKLKGAGECNPISERDCYCAQKETMNDVTYCMPEIRQRIAGDTTYQVSCLNDQLKTDATCSCAKTNTCLDKTIKGNLDGIHIPQPAAMALSPFLQMTKGTIKPGQTAYEVNSDSGKLFALAKGILKDNADKIDLQKGNLNEDQKNTLSEFEALGLSKELGAAILTSKSTPESKKNEEKFKANAGKRFALYKPYRYVPKSSGTSMKFKGGDGINGSSKGGKNNNDYASILNKLKKKKGANNGSNSGIIKFAESASRSAEITRDKNTRIFDIISRRYQVSARKRLEIAE